MKPASSRIQAAAKALILMGMGLFLYSRLANGTLYFYINERFSGYTIFAVFALAVVGISYYRGGKRQEQQGVTEHAFRSSGQHDDCDHDHDHNHDHHNHDHHNHDHHNHDHHNHSHALTWGGALLALLPIGLGLLVPPQPLGASALANREVTVSMSGGSSMPAAVRAAAAKAATEKNLLDWNQMFQSVTDPVETFAGEEVDVVGFVYRDERFGEDQFLLTRYVVSCCVADAAVVSLVVEWPAQADLAQDQWLRVTGTLVAGQVDGHTVPMVRAETVEPVEIPRQPYLYP